MPLFGPGSERAEGSSASTAQHITGDQGMLPAELKAVVNRSQPKCEKHLLNGPVFIKSKISAITSTK